ncbi:uncharacterized protein LOC144174411 [Haemaphysalis longicornis]
MATYEDVEDALLKWFVDALARNIPISGPMMAMAGYIGSRYHVVERLVIAVDRPEANLPLRVSLHSAVEMVKAARSQVAATCVRNCFRKAGFVDAKPESEPDSSDGQSSGNLRQRVIDSDMGGHDLGWDDFVCADEDADTAEPCTEEGIVNEARGKSDAEESDADDDETSEPAPISAPVYAKGLGEEHAAALNKLETALITSALQKQTAIMDFFAKK